MSPTSCGQHGKVVRGLCYVLLLQAALLLKLTDALYEGDACSMKSVSGVCTLTSKCTTLDAFIQRGHFSVRDIVSCGAAVICCPTTTGQMTTSLTLTTKTPVLIFEASTVVPNRDFRDDFSTTSTTRTTTTAKPDFWLHSLTTKAKSSMPMRTEPAVPLAPLSNTKFGNRFYSNSARLEPKPAVPLTSTPNFCGYGLGPGIEIIGMSTKPPTPKLLNQSGSNGTKQSAYSTNARQLESQNNGTIWPRSLANGDSHSSMGSYAEANGKNQPDLQWLPQNGEETVNPPNRLNNQQVISPNITAKSIASLSSTAAPQRSLPDLSTPTPANVTTPSIYERPAVRACRLIEADLKPIWTPYVLGGKPVKLGEFQHMVAIGYSKIGNDAGPYEFRCGGSLIDKKFVLTAAHCVSSRESQPSIVRMGVTNFTDEEQMRNVVEIKIKNVHIHPEFTNRYKYNDIAILELERGVDYSDNIHATCLYTELTDPPSESDLHVTGWGIDDTRRLSKHLLKAKLQISSVGSCNQSFVGDDGKHTRHLPHGVDNTQLCAFDPDVKKDACKGDSGGPLNLVLHENPKKYRVVGIISSGFPCGTAVPGLYTRVAHFLDYIEDLVWPSSK